MNRSVLIVIVDFLLISLLAFSRVDEPDVKITDPGQRATLATPSPSGDHQDLVDVLKLSLNKERESREQVTEQIRQLQAQLQTREQVLGDRDKLIREAEQMLRQKLEEAARLARDRADIERQFKLTQSNVAELQQQLTNTLSEASLSRQHLKAVRDDLKAREEEEAILKRRMAEMEKTRQAAEIEKQRLATELQIAETEKRMVREQLDSAQGAVQVERQEKAKLQEHATKLAEGVSALAEKSGELSKGVSALTEKSGELTKEIRENRPLAPNTVFNEFVTNRVRGDFRAVRTGVFGREVNREKEAKTVLVRQANKVYALYHVNDTPLSLSFPGVDWDWLIGNLRRGPAVARIERVSFLAVDPRVVVVPISEAKAQELGSKIYVIPKDPFKFQDAILVGANEGYYGECKFQMDPENPQYVRMQRERFSWLVGKFAPSSGDLVFTKGGELLGLMVNKDYCLLLTEFSPAYDIQMGIGIGDQQTGVLLSQLYGQVARMPAKLQ
jgi:X-X-X-Leu-X-X-Gly heptad repeat protein